MGAQLAHALARGEVGVDEGVVGGDGVEERGEEGPLEVEDGGFMQRAEMAIVGRWWVSMP